MPKTVYEEVKSRCYQILREDYICVASPIDEPGKQYFEHIDMLVALPRVQDMELPEQVNMLKSRKDLGIRCCFQYNFSLCTAIPWPKRLRHRGSRKMKYIQLDIRVCDTTESLQWLLFTSSSVWSFIRPTIRPYGLFDTEEGLYLRVHEIAGVAPEKCHFFLSSDPTEVLRFLRLHTNGSWDAPFNSLEDTFEYITQCRMFCSKENCWAMAKYGWPLKYWPTDYGAKVRLQKPAMREWKAFIQQCRTDKQWILPRRCPKKVCREAMAFFDITWEVDAVAQPLVIPKERKYIVEDLIKRGIPRVDPSDIMAYCFRIMMIKGLIAIITKEDVRYGIIPQKLLKNGRGQYHLGRVHEFIEKEKGAVGEAALLTYPRRYFDLVKQMRRLQMPKEIKRRKRNASDKGIKKLRRVGKAYCFHAPIILV